MNATSRHLQFGAVLLGILLIAHARSDKVDFAEHKRFDTALDQLGKVDAALNQNLLKSRFRVVSDYDGLQETLATLKNTMAVLTVMPSFVPERGREPFQRRLREFTQTLAAKEQLIEDFKSQNALLNNSLRYLPTGSRDLLAKLLADKQGRLLEKPMNRLIQQVLVHSLQPEEDEGPAIRGSLAELAAWRALHPGHPQAAAVSEVAAHVGSIVARKPRVEALTQQIVAFPTGVAAEELLRLYEVNLAAAMQRADLVRRILQGVCVLLLLGVGYTIRALDATNRSLEGRVAARTAELSAEVAQRKDAEESHQKSEHFLHSTLDALSAHIAMLDDKGTIVAVNASWRNFAQANGGRADAFDIGANYLAVCDGSNGHCSTEALAVSAGIRRVMTGEETEFQLEYPCHAPQQERWFVARVTRFFNKDAFYMVVSHENVTARVQAEKSVRMQEAELGVLFDYLPAMICFKDTENRILRANRRMAEAVGKSVREIEGKSAYEIYPNEAAKFYADDLEVIHSGVPKLGIIETFRNHEDKDTWIETDKAPVFDKEGKIIGLVAMAQDITDRRRVEEKLQRQQAELRALFDLMPAMVWFKNTQDVILRVNQRVAEIAGKSVGDIEGKPSSHTYPREAARHYQDDLEVIGSGAPKLGIIEMIRDRNDRELWLQTDKVPYCDKDGKVIGVVVLAQDITARKIAEAELKNVHQQLMETSRQAGMAEVATGVLHNVGNVLNSVNVSATLVGESLRKSKIGNLGRAVALLEAHAADLGGFVTMDPQGRNLTGYLRQLHERLCAEQRAVLEEVDSLRQNIEHIKRIVSMQQDYAKVSGFSEPVQLADLVEDTLRMNAPSFANHALRVVRDFAEVPSVTVDRHKVLQILVNLVHNAKHACDATRRSNKTMTVCIFNGDGRVKLAVSDNGIGIAPENLTRIFNHGFTTKKDGHGFGLHSSALAAQEMGGALRVESPGTGEGATFTLELPCDASPSLL